MCLFAVLNAPQRPRYPPAGISQKKSPPEAQCPNLAKIFIPKRDIPCWEIAVVERR